MSEELSWYFQSSVSFLFIRCLWSLLSSPKQLVSLEGLTVASCLERTLSQAFWGGYQEDLWTCSQMGIGLEALESIWPTIIWPQSPNPPFNIETCGQRFIAINGGYLFSEHMVKFNKYLLTICYNKVLPLCSLCSNRGQTAGKLINI